MVPINGLGMRLKQSGNQTSACCYVIVAYIEQDLETLVVAIVGRPVDGGVPMLIWDGGGTPCMEEVLQYVCVTAGGSKVDCSTALVVPGERQGGGSTFM